MNYNSKCWTIKFFRHSSHIILSISHHLIRFRITETIDKYHEFHHIGLQVVARQRRASFYSHVSRNIPAVGSRVDGSDYLEGSAIL